MKLFVVIFAGSVVVLAVTMLLIVALPLARCKIGDNEYNGAGW